VKIGDRVKLTETIYIYEGYFEEGTEMTVIKVDKTALAFVDDEGNELTDIDKWDCPHVLIKKS